MLRRDEKWMDDRLGSRKWCFMGGGGGGGGQSYYENMDKLYGQQARAAEFMLDQSMPALPEYTSNTRAMVSEAMDGTLANRARSRAAADANQAAGLSMSAANRNLARYGAEFNPNRVGQATRDAAYQGAMIRADSMNKAEQWAEDQKWNRNAGGFSQATGMGSGAMAGLSSAGAGFGSMANQINQNEQANAAGYGQAGALVASQLFKADGGYISGRNKKASGKKHSCAPGLAMGGGVWDAYKNQNPIKTGGQQTGGTSAVGSMLMGAAPTVIGSSLKSAGLGDAIKNGVKQGYEGIKGAMSGGAPAAGEAVASPVVDSVAGVTEAALPEAATTAATAAGTEAAAAAGTEAAAAAGAEAAGASALGTVGAALPWVGLAYAAGKALDLFADGGSPSDRVDMRPGGLVKGPGTETSDSIPAWLSKREFVENADAVHLPRQKTKELVEQWEDAGESTKNLLERINSAGLEMRRKKTGKEDHGKTKDGMPALASGGNLGVALGAGVQEFNRQRMMDRADRADQREQDRHNAQMAEAQRAASEAESAKAVWQQALPVFQGGWKAAAQKLGERYNANDATMGYNDGKKVDFQIRDNGVYVSDVNSDGSFSNQRFITPDQVMSEHVRGVHSQLAAVSPKYGDRFMNWLGDQEKEATRKSERGEDLAYRDKRDAVGDNRWGLTFDESKRHNRASEGIAGAGLSLRQQEAARQAEEWNMKLPGLRARFNQEQTRPEVSAALYKQMHPNATQAELDAVRAGILKATPDEDVKPTHIPLKDMNGNTESVMVFKGGQPSGLYTASDARVAKIASDPRASAIRDDAKLTIEQKKQKLQELGYR